MKDWTCWFASVSCMSMYGMSGPGLAPVVELLREVIYLIVCAPRQNRCRAMYTLLVPSTTSIYCRTVSLYTLRFVKVLVVKGEMNEIKRGAVLYSLQVLSSGGLFVAELSRPLGLPRQI